MKWISFMILIMLAGCSKQVDTENYCGVESLGEWNEIIWKHTIEDDTEDFMFFGGDVGPNPIVPYYPSDLTEASFSYDEDFVYVKFTFNEVIPDSSQKVDANGEELYIHSQGMNLAINFDYDSPNETGSMWGIDTFFAVNIQYYSQCIEPYAPYAFDNTDIHSMTDSIYGDTHPTLGGFGTNFVIARYPIELIKDKFTGTTFEIFGWAEAESYSEKEYTHELEARFHEFVHDDLNTSYFKNKST